MIFHLKEKKIIYIVSFVSMKVRQFGNKALRPWILESSGKVQCRFPSGESTKREFAG